MPLIKSDRQILSGSSVSLVGTAIPLIITTKQQCAAKGEAAVVLPWAVEFTLINNRGTHAFQFPQC